MTATATEISEAQGLNCRLQVNDPDTGWRDLTTHETLWLYEVLDAAEDSDYPIEAGALLDKFFAPEGVRR